MATMSKSPLAVARQALLAGEQQLVSFSNKHSPHRYTQPQLFAMLVLRQFFKTDYRGLVAILRDSSDLCTELGITRIPHYSTLCYAEQRLLEKGASIDY